MELNWDELFSESELAELRFAMMPLLRFESFRWPPLPTRDEAAAIVRDTIDWDNVVWRDRQGNQFMGVHPAIPLPVVRKDLGNLVLPQHVSRLIPGEGL